MGIYFILLSQNTAMKHVVQRKDESFQSLKESWCNCVNWKMAVVWYNSVLHLKKKKKRVVRTVRPSNSSS